MERFLESLRRKAEEWRKEFVKRENEASTEMRTCLRLQAKDSPELQKARGLVGQGNLYESGDRRAHDLLLMNDIRTLAEYVNFHKALIDRLDKELEESGIREMLKEGEPLRVLVDTMKERRKMAEASLKEANKTEKEMKEQLFYIS